MKVQNVILLLGGNQGNVMQVLSSAIALIEKEAGPLTAMSAVYKTGAWGPVPQPDFLNLAIQIRTQLTPGLLMQRLLNIEKRFGRKRDVKYGPRTLDIDILFFGDAVIQTELLTIPHPELQNRRFALKPCADIAPDKRHPVLNKTIRELLQICTDSLDVSEYKA